MRLLRDLHRRVGSLGDVSLNAGIYMYIGSANISRPYLRVLRHFTKRKKLKWHIDYLTSAAHAEVVYGLICYTGLDEHGLYQLVSSKLRDVCTAAIPRFGCSDTKHITHLFRCESQDSPDLLIREVLTRVMREFSKYCSNVEVISS